MSAADKENLTRSVAKQARNSRLDDPWKVRLGRLDESEEAELRAALFGRGGTYRGNLIFNRRVNSVPTPIGTSRPANDRGAVSFHFRHRTVIKGDWQRRAGSGIANPARGAAASVSVGGVPRVVVSRRLPGQRKPTVLDRPDPAAARFQAYVQRVGPSRPDSRDRELVALKSGGYAEVSSIGEAPGERIEFWRELERFEKDGQRVQNRLIAEIPTRLRRHPEMVRRLLLLAAAPMLERGLPVYAVAHLPEDGNDPRNIHMHLLYSERPASRVDGAWRFAARKHPDTRGWDWIGQLRAAYADIVNDLLDELEAPLSPNTYFPEPRFDPRRYADMGIYKLPDVHLGRQAWRLELAGYPTLNGLKNVVSRTSYAFGIEPTIRRMRDEEAAAALEESYERAAAEFETHAKSPLCTPESRLVAERIGAFVADAVQLRRFVAAESETEGRLAELKDRIEGRRSVRVRWIDRQLAHPEGLDAGRRELMSAERDRLVEDGGRLLERAERMFGLDTKLQQMAWRREDTDRDFSRLTLDDIPRLHRLPTVDRLQRLCEVAERSLAAKREVVRLAPWDRIRATVNADDHVARTAPDPGERLRAAERAEARRREIEAVDRWRAKLAAMRKARKEARKGGSPTVRVPSEEEIEAHALAPPRFHGRPANLPEYVRALDRRIGSMSAEAVALFASMANDPACGPDLSDRKLSRRVNDLRQHVPEPPPTHQRTHQRQRELER